MHGSELDQKIFNQSGEKPFILQVLGIHGKHFGDFCIELLKNLLKIIVQSPQNISSQLKIITYLELYIAKNKAQ